MLHTVALAAEQPEVAEMALNHLRNYAPMVMEIGRIVPRVVMQELVHEGKISGSIGVADEAAENTQMAWREGSQLSSDAAI
jgi:hypothetical protein